MYKETIKDLLYATYNEFLNEIDSIDDIFDKEITDKELDFGLELLKKYIDKIDMYINESEDKETLDELVANTLCNLEGQEYIDLTDKQVDEIVDKVINDNEFNRELHKLIVENIDYYVARV